MKVSGTPTRSSEIQFCGVKGCSKTTREGKPFCTEHVELNPYATQVLAELRKRDSADERASSGRPEAEDVTSVTATEIIQIIEQHGPKTLQGLSRELNIDEQTVLGYINLLRDQKLVKVGSTKRGNPLVSLVR